MGTCLRRKRELVGNDGTEEWFDVGVEVATGVDLHGGLSHAGCRRLGDVARGDGVGVGDLDKGLDTGPRPPIASVSTGRS